MVDGPGDLGDFDAVDGAAGVDDFAARLPGSPDSRVGGSEEDYGRNSEGSRDVRGSGIVADEETGAGDECFDGAERRAGDAFETVERGEVLVAGGNKDGGELVMRAQVLSDLPEA